MITVGLVNEMRFISKALRTPIELSFKTEKIESNIQLYIKEQILNVYYRGYAIWTETLEEGVTMFGVESCDTLAKIILLIDSGDDEKWRPLVYRDK